MKSARPENELDKNELWYYQHFLVIYLAQHFLSLSLKDLKSRHENKSMTQTNMPMAIPSLLRIPTTAGWRGPNAALWITIWPGFSQLKQGSVVRAPLGSSTFTLHSIESSYVTHIFDWFFSRLQMRPISVQSDWRSNDCNCLHKQTAEVVDSKDPLTSALEK